MSEEYDVPLADGRTVHVHDSGRGSPDLTLLWQTGSPQTGALLPPLVEAAAARNIRLLSYGRPGYSTSTPQPGRTVADAASDVAQIADAAGVPRFAVMGASGGGPHTLAAAAVLGPRILGAVTLAGIAPVTDDFDWFAGMQAPGGLRAALRGRDARLAYAEIDEFDADSFIAADWQLLESAWSSLGDDSQKAGTEGSVGLVDDDVAFTSPWGFDVGAVGVPTLVVQGGLDRVVPVGHGDWLLRSLPRAELWLRPRDGHVSVLAACPVAMDWLLELPGGA
jgi:pimeloyl-ACP methyl ester carboxylesterase